MTCWFVHSFAWSINQQVARDIQRCTAVVERHIGGTQTKNVHTRSAWSVANLSRMRTSVCTRFAVFSTKIFFLFDLCEYSSCPCPSLSPRRCSFCIQLDNMKQEATFDNQGCCRWIRLKYYHYSLWTGIYMLDKWERVLFSTSLHRLVAAVLPRFTPILSFAHTQRRILF